MYGSIFHMKAKAGQEQRTVEQFEAWERNRRPKIDGALGGLVMRPDGVPGTVVAVAIFRDKESYQANFGRPGTG